jgi:hypothetical protein
MGVVRKTLSIGTLGLVSFRSKKEKLRRAERARADAELALEDEHNARETAEIRIAAAEKRLKQATSEASRTAHQLEKVKRQRKGRRSKALSGLLATAEPIVRSGVDTAKSASTDAAKRGRKAGRRARKATAKATTATKDAVVPRAEKVVSKVGEAIDQM